MKQSNFLCTKELFPGSDVVRNYSFKTVETRHSYALLAKENHNLAMNFAISGEGSAHFRKRDCFECLSPHRMAE